MEEPALHIVKFDVESDGLLPELTTLHSLCMISSKYGKVSCAHDARYTSIERGLEILAEADLIIGHNILGFDLLAIKKLYPNWRMKKGARILDTLILARMLFPDVHKTKGINNHKLMPFEKRLHGLEIWGKRLGEFKGDYSKEMKAKGLDPWAQWSVTMQDYCEQDVVVTDKLFLFLMSRKPTPASMEIESEFAKVIVRQEQRGFAFDFEGGIKLAARLGTIEAEIEQELIETYGEWWQPAKNAKSLGWAEAKAKSSIYKDGVEDEDDYVEITREEAEKRLKEDAASADVVVPDRTWRRALRGVPDITLPRYSAKTGKRLKDYVGPPQETITEGCAYTPIKRVQFNPSSRAHIRKVLYQRYNWLPLKWTKASKQFPKGQPVVDDDVLRGLASKIPECGRLADYFVVLKRLGQISTGKKAWLKLAVQKPNGEYRIHGRVNTCGANSSRCTHMSPNLAQVPANTAEYGHECRSLFIPGIGYVLVGWDGKALELRCLGHYVAPYDGGAYARIVESSDPHAWLRDLIGRSLMGGCSSAALDCKCEECLGGRAKAKTSMYAYIYGAGDLKIGLIIAPTLSEKEQREIGGEAKHRIGNRFEALKELQKFIDGFVEANGNIKALDGRILPIRKAHATLNLLLQSAGAIAMKKGAVIQNERLSKILLPGRDFEFVGNIHDEVQAEVLPPCVDQYIEISKPSLTDAGDALKMRCALDSDFKHGMSWAETH